MPVITFDPLMAARPSRALRPGTGMPAFSSAIFVGILSPL